MVRIAAPKHILLTAAGAAIDMQPGSVTLKGAGDAGIFKAHISGARPKVTDAPGADLTADNVLDMQRRLIEQGKGRTANTLRSYLHAAYQCTIDVRMSAALPVAFKAATHINPVAQTKRDRVDKHSLGTPGANGWPDDLAGSRAYAQCAHTH